MAFKIPSQWGPQDKIPTVAPTSWTRPIDWPVITDTNGEVQFLTSDQGYLTHVLKTSFTQSASENLYIDWGDGVIDTISTTADTWTSHTYTFGAGTPCSQGYTTWKIRVYVDSGATINNCVFDSNGGTLIPYASTLAVSLGVLEVYYGDGTQSVSLVGAYNGINRGVYCSMMEYFKFPSNISSNTDTNYLAGVFNDSAFNLAKVVLPTNAGTETVRTIDSTFRNCFNLESITFPQTISISSLGQAFQNCFNLNSVVFPTNDSAFNLCTDLNNAFVNCRSIQSLIVPPLPACTTLSSTFNGCVSLQQIELQGLMSSVNSVNVSSTFFGCTMLRSVKFPNSVAAGSTFNVSATNNGMFRNCRNLKSIIFPINWDGSFYDMLSQCNNLNYVRFQSPFVTATNWTSCFSNCWILQKVILASSGLATINMTSAFAACRILEEITIPTGWNISNLFGTFASCSLLKNVNFETTSCDSLTSIAGAFDACNSLDSLIFPASVNFTTVTTTAFQNCTTIKTITFPSNMNTTAFSSTFINCYSLRSVTLPTTTASTNFNNTFQRNYSLLSITLPPTVGAVTTYDTTASQCYSLKTFNFPTSLNTTVATFNLVFNRCTNLRTINNIDSIREGSNFLPYTVFSGTFYLSSLLDVYAKLSAFSAAGSSTVFANQGVNSFSALRLRSTAAGQWSGSSPQISIAYTNMSTSAIIDLFNDLALQPNVTGKTIDITSATGTAGLTAGDRAIVTAKGWTITG